MCWPVTDEASLRLHSVECEEAKRLIAEAMEAAERRGADREREACHRLAMDRAEVAWDAADTDDDSEADEAVAMACEEIARAIAKRATPTADTGGWR